MTDNTGHFGMNAWRIGIFAVAALVLHLAVPFGVIAFDGETDTQSRGDMADGYDGYNAASPGVMLAGAIIMVVGALALIIFGLIPMPVGTARWAGWAGALATLVGGMMAFTSSMFWVGTGFAQALDALFNTSGDGFWIISPVLVAVLAGITVWTAFKIMRDVTPANGREEADRHLRAGRLALVLIGLTLFVPWALQTEGDTAFYSAHTVIEIQDATSDAGGFFGGGMEMFSGMAYALKVFQAGAWIGVLGAALATTGGLLAATTGWGTATRWTPFTRILAPVMAAWMVVLYVLMWAYMWKPSWEDGATTGQTWLPGFFPILVATPLVLWGLAELRNAFALRGAVGKQAMQTKKVSFD